MLYRDHIQEILKLVQDGKKSAEEAFKQLQDLPYENLDFANLDHHRVLRTGFSEVIFCENKTPQQAAVIFERLAVHHDVLGTRASVETFSEVSAKVSGVEYNETARTIAYRHPESNIDLVTENKILVLSAGTADIPVAEEVVVTARMLRNPVNSLYDVGVAGIHRILGNKDKLAAANVIVVVAGMDGALPSVIGGLVGKPVIAVPTSVGYGANLAGIAPLLTMLNSCAPGVVVVNIDNGFGAGHFAALINR